MQVTWIQFKIIQLPVTVAKRLLESYTDCREQASIVVDIQCEKMIPDDDQAQRDQSIQDARSFGFGRGLLQCWPCGGTDIYVFALSLCYGF